MPKWWRQLCAWVTGTFWLPCYVCGSYFSGNEWARMGFPSVVTGPMTQRGTCSAACAKTQVEQVDD